MTLKPFHEYAATGTQSANAKWESRLKLFVGGFAIVGIVVGLAAGQIGIAVLGAFVGGIVGYGIFRLVVFQSASNTAEELYIVDWCSARGMRHIGDDYFPNNAPYASSGDKQKATDAFEGTWNGLATLFYNFTWTEKGGSDDPDVDYDYKIMRLTGRELPIRKLTIHQRSALNKFKWVDKVQGMVTKERPISLESAAFNQKFDLTIDDLADEIWIRRIFDPATIQSLLDGQFTIPDVRYYDRAWWFVEREHFEIRDLDSWIPKQKQAADAVEHLSRVQSL